MDANFFELFDKGTDRRGSGCEKWDARAEVFGREDVIPLWVADMDFPSPAGVRHAIIHRAEHGVFGYEKYDESGAQAVVNWMNTRHHTQIKSEWVSFSPGVVDSQRIAVAALLKAGDLVAVQPPVYGPFYDSIRRHGCDIYRNRLLHTKDGWKMDLDHLEDGLKKGVKMVLLCSPHNPVGRVWTVSELKDLAALCRRYDAYLVADEIHADFEMPGHVHTSILKVDERAICLISCTKTFNLAALRHSSVMIADEEIRGRFRAEADRRGASSTNLFGGLAQKAAYQTGGAWLDALIEYLDGTRRIVEEYCAVEMPDISVSHLEGTYLMWLDMRAYGLKEKELCQILIQKAGVGLTGGTGFGEEGEGFMRLNIATPRTNVTRALENIKLALGKR